jgi:hypothetical protein
VTYTAVAFWSDGKQAYSWRYDTAEEACAYAVANALPHGGMTSVQDPAGREVHPTEEQILAKVPDHVRTDVMWGTLLGLSAQVADDAGPMRAGENYIQGSERRQRAAINRQVMWQILMNHPAYDRAGVTFTAADDAVCRVVHLLVAAAVVRVITDTGQAVA